jgi:hypothetical protein
MYRFADEDEDSNKKIHEGLIPILEELSKLHFEESWVIAVNNGELMIVGSSPERLFDAFYAALEDLGG